VNDSYCCDVHIKTMFGSYLPPFVCRRAHVLFALFAFVCVQWYLARIDRMGGMHMAVSCGRRELLSLRGRLGSPPIFAWIRVGQLFSFLCFVFLVCCLRPVSSVPNVASFSGLSVIDSHFGFL
jgi:hypothetical protein